MGDIVLSGHFLATISVDKAYSNSSGKYFQSNSGKLIERRSSKLSYDEQRAKKLWNDTKILIHLQPNEDVLKLR